MDKKTTLYLVTCTMFEELSTLQEQWSHAGLSVLLSGWSSSNFDCQSTRTNALSWINFHSVNRTWMSVLYRFMKTSGGRTPVVSSCLNLFQSCPTSLHHMICSYSKVRPDARKLDRLYGQRWRKRLFDRTCIHACMHSWGEIKRALFPPKCYYKVQVILNAAHIVTMPQLPVLLHFDEIQLWRIVTGFHAWTVSSTVKRPTPNASFINSCSGLLIFSRVFEK